MVCEAGLQSQMFNWACGIGAEPQDRQCCLQVALAQNDNLSWFGYPDDTTPSARDFLPGLQEVGTPPRRMHLV